MWYPCKIHALHAVSPWRSPPEELSAGKSQYAPAEAPHQARPLEAVGRVSGSAAAGRRAADTCEFRRAVLSSTVGGHGITSGRWRALVLHPPACMVAPSSAGTPQLQYLAAAPLTTELSLQPHQPDAGGRTTAVAQEPAPRTGAPRISSWLSESTFLHREPRCTHPFYLFCPFYRGYSSAPIYHRPRHLKRIFICKYVTTP